MIKQLAVFVVILIGFSSRGLSSSYEFALTNEQKIVTVGDVHGDLDALFKILFSAKVINQRGDWIFSKNHLVFTGDLVDRGPHSKEVMDFVMRLEADANSKGGHVHPLLGNHEFMLTEGDIRYAHPNDIEKIGAGSEKHFVEQFQHNSTYAKWFRTRPVAVKIGESLFVHGGLGRWALKTNLEEINLLAHLWLAYFQQIGPQPEKSTEWVVNHEGPFWNRGFMVHDRDFRAPKKLTDLEVSQALRHYGVKRVVVGHSIVDSLDMMVGHPWYGEKVLMIDSAISVAYRGDLTSLQISNQGVAAAAYDRESGMQIQSIYPASACAQAFR